MKRRWIIRSFFIGLLLLCVGGWVYSGTHTGEINYVRNGCFVQCGTESGVVYVGSGGKRGAPGIANGCFFASISNASRDDALPARFWPLGPSQIPSFLGFFYARAAPTSFSVGGVDYASVPYWFLILLVSFALFVVWWKTRKSKPGRAFPVEMTAKKA